MLVSERSRLTAALEWCSEAELERDETFQRKNCRMSAAKLLEHKVNTMQVTLWLLVSLVIRVNVIDYGVWSNDA